MYKLFATILFLIGLSACASNASMHMNGNPSVRVHIQSQSRKDVYANYVFVKNSTTADSVRVSLCGYMHTTLRGAVDTVDVQLPARTCGVSARVYIEAFKNGSKYGWASMNYRTNYVNPALYNNFPQLGCRYNDWVVTDSSFKGNLPYSGCYN